MKRKWMRNIIALCLYAVCLGCIVYLFLFRLDTLSTVIKVLLVIAFLGILLNVKDRIAALRALVRAERAGGGETSGSPDGSSGDAPGNEPPKD